MNVRTMSYQPTPTRPARDGEICFCGKPAIDVFLCADLGPVPFCGTAGDDHKPSDCPPWCIQDHEFPFDRRHMSESRQVKLDAYPWQHVVGERWLTEFQALLIGLTKEPGAKPAYIEIIGVNDKLAGCLTAYEAEQLAGILQELATTLRNEATP